MRILVAPDSHKGSLSALMSIVPGPISLDECMAAGNKLIEEAAARVCRLILVRKSMQG